MQGTGTADVSLQEAHIGPGSSADALASWKAGHADESAYHTNFSGLPGDMVTGRPILGTADNMPVSLCRPEPGFGS